MQEQNKASLPRAAAVCPSNPSVPTGPSLASSLATTDIEAIVQQDLSRTSTTLFVTLGIDLLFTNHGVDVQDPPTGQVLGTGRKVGCMFEVYDLKIPSQAISTTATTATPSPDLWHARLGHPSLSRLQLLTPQDSHGTLPQRSCPYTSQQNGRAEQKLRHILDVVCTLLISASLLECFWGEAALIAVYTINRIPSPTTHNKSPFELLYGQTPDYSSLQGFRCYDPISHRLRVSRHVEFWEHCPFTSLQQFPASSSSESPIFTNLFLPLYPELVEDSSTSTAFPDDSSPIMSPEYDLPVLDPVAPPSPESPVGTELRHFTQEYDIDYEETFAPVAHLTSVRCLIVVATVRRWPLYQMDVNNASFNGDL
ncbi:uncharacterized protein LOC142632003 [Castanea sativa]|uniref:uncharacterized protein LOC142632003 n=1 Tax=Castanea sativa TaxID=21020 RepID=UPI003F64C6F5